VGSNDALVVVQKGDHSLGYYDLSTGAERHRVGLDPFPRDLALSPDGRRAYICHFGVALPEDPGDDGRAVSIVDLARRRRVGTLDCGEHRRPHGAAVDLAGAVYVVADGSDHLLVAGKPTSGRFDATLPTHGRGPHSVTVTRDGSLAFVSHPRAGTVSVLFPGDPERPAVVIKMAGHPEGSALDEDERRLYVACRERAELAVVDVKRLAVTMHVRTARGPVRVCSDGNGLLLVPLAHDRSLAIMEAPAGVRQRRVPLPAPPVSIAYHGGSRCALVTTLSHEVCVIDVAKARVARRISTRRDPDAVAVVSLAD
jgi:DNA-binding beta-propeller fold protein YncE